MDDEYQPRNREKARQAHRYMTWCYGCDCDEVSDFGKRRRCRRCGKNQSHATNRIRYF